MTRLLHQPLGLLHRPMGGLRHQVGSYSQRIINLFGSDLIGYWPMNEVSGMDAVDISPQGNDGSYTGVTLANAACPAKIGGYSPLFDGTNDYNDLGSAGFRSLFQTTAEAGEFSISTWFKVYNAGVWTDGTERQILRILVDGSNFIYLRKPTTNNKLEIDYKGGGVYDRVEKTSFSDAGWNNLTATVSVSNDRFRGYLNGDALTPATGIGTWSGLPNGMQTLIGASITTPVAVWYGWLAHILVVNREMTATEAANLYSWGL